MIIMIIVITIIVLITIAPLRQSRTAIEIVP